MKVSETDIIYKTRLISDKIYVKEQTGFYQAIRQRLSWVLMSVFLLLPLVDYQHRQAIWFDVANQQFHFFNYTLFPHDFMALVFLFVVAAFALFWLSAKFGRTWCGFSCPQTIWTLMFIWVENRIEGNRQQRISLDKRKWTNADIFKKLSKHLIWLSISLITAIVFISYFIPAKRLYAEIFTLNLSTLTSSWILFFSLCTYVNAGLVREKMCQHMCPYARFQSAMISPESVVVTYDAKRGENRGPRKVKSQRPEGLGDCVDCDLCVQVCPVGIDIRDGFQADCINCGLCVDACNETMSRFGYQANLISYSSQAKDKSPLKANAYLLIASIFVIIACYWGVTRTEIEMTLSKDRHILYRETDNGNVENIYRAELINKTNSSKSISLDIQNPHFVVITDHNITLNALESRTINVVVQTAAQNQLSQFTRFRMVALDSENGERLLTRNATFQRNRVE
jgi:cytochrome c oxidase accessory protein FixG